MFKALVGILLVFFSLGNLPGEASGAATLSAPQVLELIEKNTFKNISFDFSTVESRKAKGQDQYSITYWDNGRMYLNGQPNSLIKASYTPSTSIWLDASSQYYQEYKTVAYNGKYWLTCITDSGAINAMTRNPTAVITKERPNGWSAAGRQTGEIFLVTHAPVFNNYTIAHILKQYSEHSWPIFRSYKVQITEDNYLLKISIAASASFPLGTEVWLDLQKGGALKKIITKGQIMTEEVTIEDFQEVGGIWFPTKGTRIAHIENDKRVTRLDFTATHFSIIDQADGLYDVELPLGCRVEDKRSNASLVIGREINKIVK